MLESMTMFVGEELAATQLGGGQPRRLGNRSERCAPQGVYPCAGDDRWIAISIESDLEWRRLCDAAGLDARFAQLDVDARRKQHDAIDAALARFTRACDADALMAELQPRGILACRVSDAPALVDDPHLAARGFWAELDHPETGRRRAPGIAIRLDHTPATFRLPAPLLGQHNREVLRERLELCESELDALERAGLLVDRPAEERR
jgi:benzylsuccinate CoA-transferase BbsF subunit